MTKIISRFVPKAMAIREEDYWIVAASIVTIICIAATIYASVLTFRVPVFVVGSFGLWFTTFKVKKGYGSVHANWHVGLTLLASVLLFLAIYFLTN